MSNIYKILVSYIVLFAFFFLYFAIVGYKNSIPEFVIWLHVYFAVTYFACLLHSVLTNKAIFLYSTIFLYSLFSSLLVRFCSFYYLNEPFFGGVDSYTYDYLARVSLTSGFSYFEYLGYLSYQSGLNLDDFGMTSICYFIYNLFGDVDNARIALLVFNSFIILLLSIRLNNLMRLMDVNSKVRSFCLVAFACFPFLSVTAAVGLKENIFVFLILSAFNYMLKYRLYGGKTLFIKACLYTFSCLFFRTAIFAMVVLSFIIFTISNTNNKRKILHLIIAGSFGGIILLDLLLTVLFGRSLEFYFSVSEGRMETMGQMGGTMKWIVQGLASLFGPFPNFNRYNSYTMLLSPGLLLKMLFNLFMVFGLFRIIKHYDYRKYHLLVYFLANTAMFILASVALDIRYQITMYPLMIPIIADTIQNTKFRKSTFFGYFLFVAVLIFYYNIR